MGNFEIVSYKDQSSIRALLKIRSTQSYLKYNLPNESLMQSETLSLLSTVILYFLSLPWSTGGIWDQFCFLIF